jgi:hypothetical protein
MKVDGTVDPTKLGMAIAEAMVKAGSPSLMQKGVGASVGPYVHGPGGLFGVRGLERGIISTHTQITGSLGEILPIQGSMDMNPLFPYITGFLRSDQQEKNGICDEPEEAAPFKTCIQTTVFGRKEFKTRELEVNRLGQRINRGEFMDLQLENSPLVNSMGGLMRDFFGLNNQAAAIAGNDVVMRMVEVGVAFQRWFCPQVYTGNPANSSAGGGYKEFAGLDLLISRTKVDALAGTTCPSLYSDIKSFGFRNVNSTADPDIVRTLTTMIRILTRKAVQQGMAPVQLAIVMREPLFYELTRVWPCQYNTDSCIGSASNGLTGTITMNDDFQVRMRDAMRNGMYLLIDGRQVPVIIDDCIMEENRADNGAIPIGGFASDIYIVPLSARGGTIKTLYWEYFNYNGPNAAVPSMSGLPKWFWSDNGAFLWTMLTPHVWCVDFAAKVEPRLILRTPQLAGRLTDVVYVPLQHTDDPLPSQDYHVNGGVRTGYPFASPYSEWNLNGPGPGA